jgi:hypothetical protein
VFIVCWTMSSHIANANTQPKSISLGGSRDGGDIAELASPERLPLELIATPRRRPAEADFAVADGNGIG